MSKSEEITVLLNRMSAGDENAPEKLLPLVYQDLRNLARVYLKQERSDHTLQATALVHEAYLDVREMRQYSWQNRAHFVGVMANLMRRVLVDYARRYNAEKRSGGNVKVPLSQAEHSASVKPNIDLVELDRVLERFSVEYPRRAKIVELKFFGGLSVEETAEVLGIAPVTVSVNWRLAKAWLAREIRGQ